MVAGKSPAEKIFTRVERERTFERVAEHIRKLIIQGKISPGEALPPERELSATLGVTRNTLREALRYLENTGLVRVVPGKGSIVNDFLSSSGVEMLEHYLRHNLSSDPALIREVVEARSALGSVMIEAGLRNLTGSARKEVISLIQEFVTLASRKPVSHEELQIVDLKIHERIIRASGNRVYIFLHNSVKKIYLSLLREFTFLFSEPVKIARIYQRIASCLRKGDTEGAVRHFRKYFNLHREVYKP